MKLNSLRLFLLCAAALAVACQPPGAASGGQPGSLEITVSNDFTARTIAPDPSLTQVSYYLVGLGGPKNAQVQFASYTPDKFPLSFNGLAFGNWTVSVVARNANDVDIGWGQANVQAGPTPATCSVSVGPVQGVGTLDLTVNWDPSQVQGGQVTGTITPLGGSATALSFTGGTGTATDLGLREPDGYYTLTFTLSDYAGNKVGGWADAAWIVGDQKTEGVYCIKKMNTGGLTVLISTNLNPPLDVSINGNATQIAGTTQNLKAVPKIAGTYSYQWFVNGVADPAGTTYSYAFTPVTPGYYEVDVVISKGSAQAGCTGLLVTVN
jgi:hypothetical protein